MIARADRISMRQIKSVEGGLSVLLNEGVVALHEAGHGLFFFSHLPRRELANVGFCSLGFDVPEVPVIFQPSSFIGVGLDRRLPLDLLAPLQSFLVAVNVLIAFELDLILSALRTHRGNLLLVVLCHLVHLSILRVVRR